MWQEGLKHSKYLDTILKPELPGLLLLFSLRRITLKVKRGIFVTSVMFFVTFSKKFVLKFQPFSTVKMNVSKIEVGDVDFKI